MAAEKSEENNGIMLTHRKDVGAEVLQSKGIQSEMDDSYEENGELQNGFHKSNTALQGSVSRSVWQPWSTVGLILGGQQKRDRVILLVEAGCILVSDKGYLNTCTGLTTGMMLSLIP